MLQILLSFFVVSFTAITWGLPFFLIPAYKKKSGLFTTENIILSFFAGLAVIAILSSWISLFFPVRFWILLLFTVPLVILEAAFLKQVTWKIDLAFFRKNKPVENLFITICILLFCFLATGKPTMEDSDLYHVQTIKWIHDYGTVPGLANLYLRYGLYSNWFHTIAIFQLPLQHQNFVFLNHAFTVWFFLFLFYQYKKNKEKSNHQGKHWCLFYFTLLSFLLVEWDLFRVSSSSTSYDFVITGIVLICFNFLLKKTLLAEESGEEKNIVILLIVSAPFFKMTGFLITPFIFLFLIAERDRLKCISKVIAVGMIALVPYLAKNVLQAGYLFFPYQIADVFQSSWKLPEGMVYNFNKYIYLGNHYINQEIPKAAWESGLSFSYYSDWFLHLVKMDKAMIICSLIALPLSFRSMKKIYGRDLKKLFGLFFFTIVAIIFWFLESPDLRFCFGFLLFIAFFPLTALIANFIKPWIYSLAMILIVVGIGYYVYQKGKKTFEAENFLHVEQVDLPPYKKQLINKTIYNVPEVINNNWNSRCLDCPVPCIYEINPFLHTIGKETKDGFKMSPYPDSSFIKNYRY